MLNYVWLGLLLLGIGVALSTDIVEQSNNKYMNGKELKVTAVFNEPFDAKIAKSYDVKISIDKQEFNSFYNVKEKTSIEQTVKVTVVPDKKKNLIFLQTDGNTPEILKNMAKITGKEDDITGVLKISSFSNSTTANAKIVWEEITFARMKEVTSSALNYAATAVNIAMGLIGIMALWLGIMKIAEEAGLIRIIARIMSPVTKLLFPEVPPEHPAMGAMIMNMSANMLGLGNAATPFGLKAMEELDKLNPTKGTASNAMCTFLAINTSGLMLIPAQAIAVRAASGSADPAIIIGTTMFGAFFAFVFGVTSAKIMEKFSGEKGELLAWFKSNIKFYAGFFGIVALLVVLSLTGALSKIGSLFSFLSLEGFKSVIQVVSILAIPAIIFSFVTYGFFKKVKIYETFIEGAKEGFNVAIRIIPYLVAMLVAIGVFRAGGAMDFLTMVLQPVTSLIGMPAEALPMALMRPLSGSGSLGVMAEIMKVHGPDSFIGILVSTLFGSSETTFYVIAVYFGSVNIRKTRHALPAGLFADLGGTLAAIFIVRLLFGSL
ncbi:MAG: nucleoside recognition domain-containing protein [bacterium]